MDPLYRENSMFEQPASTDSVTSAARRSFIKTIAAGAALGSVGSLFPSVVRAQRAETIKIGFVVPLTGPYASEAQAEVKGAELALKDRAYVMDQGVIVHHDDARALLADSSIQERYCSV